MIECLEGTPFVTWWLRAMGARVARRVVLGSSPSTFHRAYIGDGAHVAEGSVVMKHAS